MVLTRLHAGPVMQAVPCLGVGAAPGERPILFRCPVKAADGEDLDEEPARPARLLGRLAYVSGRAQAGPALAVDPRGLPRDRVDVSDRSGRDRRGVAAGAGPARPGARGESRAAARRDAQLDPG